MVAGSGTGFTSDWNCIVSTVPSDQESWNAVCTVPFFTPHIVLGGGALHRAKFRPGSKDANSTTRGRARVRAC